MTGHQWLDVLIGIAIALLLILLLLIAVLVMRRPKGKLAAAYRRFSSSDAVPGRKLRRRLLVLSVLVILNVICLGLLLSRAPGEQVVEPATTQSATPGSPSSSAGPSQASEPRRPTSTTTPGASDNTGSGSAEQETIQVESPAQSARPFQTVRIEGTYRGGADILLRVQRWEGGEWVGFPLPTKTDQSGRFTAYVEFGQPGRYQLRVLDPDSGVTSRPFVVVVRG
jgi:preprotein translocase subunit SecG